MDEIRAATGWALAILGLGLLVAGGVIGFLPVTVGGLSCGSTFRSSHVTDPAGICSAITAERAPSAASPLAAGLVLVIGGLWMTATTPRR